jgi:predicted Zn-dependent protease
MSRVRFGAIALSLVLGCASVPAPAGATSTQTEVDIGKQYDKQIVASYNLITDPLLLDWTQQIGERVWSQTVRKDVPYSLKILDEPDVNAFSTLGGFIYVNEGLLDFAQSDDELAGVIGHETGHIERRHAIQNNNKAQVIGILTSIGSIFVPFIYQFGNIIDAGIMAKIEREDEYQADKYGLMLEARAGYDPEAMVSFMRHLDAVADEHDTIIDKYLKNHPDTPKRVAALVGYPELDPKVVTEQQRLAAAIHDEDEARYAVAAREFSQILAADPGNATAAYYLGVSQIALGDTDKSQQSLAVALSSGSPETQALATTQMSALRDVTHRVDLLHVDLQPLRDQVAAAQAAQTQAVGAIQARRDAARDQIDALQKREDAITYGMPQVNGSGKPGSRMEAVINNIAVMQRALETANAKTTETINGIGTLVYGKKSGLVAAHDELLARMASQLAQTPPSPLVLSELPSYPRVLQSLQRADVDMVRALDGSRAALALLDVALTDLDSFIREIGRTRVNHQGDIDQFDYADLQTATQKAVTSLNKAAVAAAQSAQLYNLARARETSARIDLLGLAATPERYQTLVRALDVRFHQPAIDYQTMLADDLSPSDVVAATIIAADTKAAPLDIVAEAKRTNKPFVDVANARGMQGLALEIFLKLVYFDYADDPDREARGGIS